MSFLLSNYALRSSQRVISTYSHTLEVLGDFLIPQGDIGFSICDKKGGSMRGNKDGWGNKADHRRYT